jgi:hypothetical protein
MIENKKKERFFNKDFWRGFLIALISIFIFSQIYSCSVDKQKFLSNVRASHNEAYNNLKWVLEANKATSGKGFYIEHMSLNNAILNSLLESPLTDRFGNPEYYELLTKVQEKIAAFNTVYPMFLENFKRKDFDIKTKEEEKLLMRSKGVEVINILRQYNDYLIEKGWDNKHLDQKWFYNNLSPEARKILATLWRYQEQILKDDQRKRISFTISNDRPEYPSYISGRDELVSIGLIAPGTMKDYCQLTDEGLDFVKKNHELKNYSDIYVELDASHL